MDRENAFLIYFFRLRTRQPTRRERGKIKIKKWTQWETPSLFYSPSCCSRRGKERGVVTPYKPRKAGISNCVLAHHRYSRGVVVTAAPSAAHLSSISDPHFLQPHQLLNHCFPLLSSWFLVRDLLSSLPLLGHLFFSRKTKDVPILLMNIFCCVCVRSYLGASVNLQAFDNSQNKIYLLFVVLRARSSLIFLLWMCSFGLVKKFGKRVNA